MGAHPLFEVIARHRLVAVVRTDDAAQALRAGEACLRGGVRLLEVTLTVPDALAAVARLAALPDAVVGVGSVMAAPEVRDAASAGAHFVVSPHFDADVLAEAKARGLFCAPGAATPTEVLTCQRAGADVVKVFPASAFGGPAYLKALREPMPFLRLMPTGGVDASNLRAYLDAGACGVGLGGSLVDRKSVANGDFAAIEARARGLVQIVQEWLSER